jgi:hypothetical protein
VPAVDEATNLAEGRASAVSGSVGAEAEAEAEVEGRAWRYWGASASAHAARVPIRRYPDLVHLSFSMHARHSPNAGHDMTAGTHANAEAAAAAAAPD